MSLTPEQFERRKEKLKQKASRLLKQQEAQVAKEIKAAPKIVKQSVKEYQETQAQGHRITLNFGGQEDKALSFVPTNTTPKPKKKGRKS